MTPQENDLVAELFDRLAKLETTPRDPDAERLIADGARQAPHALYALVQTTLLQDEALKRANARIEELQAQVDEPPQPGQRQGSFLDSMRATFGGGEPRGSVPSVRAQIRRRRTRRRQARHRQATRRRTFNHNPPTRRRHPAMPAARRLAPADRSLAPRPRPRPA